MSEDRVVRVDEIPSGCPSPARLEKTDSSSSRQSTSPLHWDLEPSNRSERIRPSSWDDDSDDDSSPQISGSTASRIYSSESNAFKGSVTSEINELKKQFFQTLEKQQCSSTDSMRLETLREKLEITLKCDRRQSPARVRRRSRSSSSSSPAPETQMSPETKDKGTGPDSEPDDSDTTSPRTLTTDPRYYLNNFFSELRSKRISMLQPAPLTEKTGKDGVLICDNMKLEMLNELNASDLNEDGSFFCKTSRKLSQILEVEENRKDLEKGSEDSMDKLELLGGSVGKPEVGDSCPSLQTSRSNRGERLLHSGRDVTQKNRQGYRSLSFEEFGHFQKVAPISRGSLSERSGRMFEPRIDEGFINLCAKTGTTRLSSPRQTAPQDLERSFQFLCFAGPLGANQTFSAGATPRPEDSEKSSNRSERLIRAEMSGSPTPRKKTDRSDQNHTDRTKSGHSRGSSHRQSPTFALKIEGDSARSLRVDDVSTPLCQSRGKGKKSTSGSKRPSSEECSVRSSGNSTFRSDDTCESKTDRNLHITLESPSLKSVQSSRSCSEHRTTRNDGRSAASTQRSQRKGSSRAASAEPTPTGQNLSTKSCRNSPVGSGRSSERTNNTSCRSELSKKTPKSPKSKEDSSSSRASDPKTPRSHKIPELELPIEIIGRPESQKDCRTPKDAELDDGVRDTNRSHSTADRPSGRSSAARSGRLRKSTPRSRSSTPMTSDSNSPRSKGSLEKQKPPAPHPEEFEPNYDALSSHTPVSVATRRSASRETDLPSQPLSCRSQNSAARITFTPRPGSSLEEEPLGSRNSPKIAGELLGSICPGKSERTKSRPASRTSAETKFTDVPPTFEKLDVDVRSGGTTHRSYLSEEYEEKEEHPSSSGSNSDRHSAKRLSIINEVTFEDLENSAATIENDQRDFWEKSRPPSRRSRKRVSPKSARTLSENAPTGESFKGRLRHESASRSLGREMWAELIETFEGSQKSSLFSENNFPGFPPPKEGDSAGLSVYLSTTETPEKLYDDDSGDLNLADSFDLSRKTPTPKSERKKMSGRPNSDRQLEEDFSFSLACKDSLMEKMKAEDERPLPSPQTLFYVDVDKGSPFGIGEFGDVTWWDGGKSDLQDLDKPKDHGDGLHAFQSSEVLALKPEKREKEMKNQRQLWTELREDFRDSRLLSGDRFPVESDADGDEFVPVDFKTSKSDTCINRMVKEGNEYQSSGTCDFFSENSKPDAIEQRDMSSNNMADCFGSGSVDSATGELDCERTPRLTRSMSDLVTQLPLEKYKNDELAESPNSSSAQLFEKPAFRQEKEDPVSASSFLERKRKEETEAKASNWLQLKTLDRKKSEKRDKKAKSKMKKGPRSRQPSVEYLISRKRQPSITRLKLRNSNCFQNFYKRFISVFCVTSNSSAATSK